MTHGDQAKAKAAKTSQASGSKKVNGKTSGQAVQSGKGSKVGSKEGGESSKAAKIVVKKDQTGAEKSSSAAAQKAGSSAKEAGNSGKTSSKGRSADADASPGFTNPAVANAFKRAVKKYPNAFRKLTD